MNGKEQMSDKIRYFWFTDIIVILICLSTATGSIYLFRRDLMRTIDSYDVEPAGIIVIRNNIVQRRHEDRVLWDRIFVDSPVYSGDLIRAAELSAATIYIDTNQISLNENTLIRILGVQGTPGIQGTPGAPETQGTYHIELQEGNLSLNTGAEGSGITLNLMGRFIQAASGTVLNAEKGEDGIIVQVNEGSATFVEEGQTRELSEGAMIAQDAKGVERIIPAAVVMYPQPNARYLNNSPEPLPINFEWKRINLENEETLKLEIAKDKNFTKDVQIIEDLSSHAQAPFDVGLWYWRLLYEKTRLGSGQLTVVDASGPELSSPAEDSIFRYQNDPPQLRFQWAKRPEASHYIIEIDKTGNFEHPHISKQLSSASLIQSGLEQGTWYWRVQPVFPPAYQGSAGYSSAASFRIEQSSDPQAPAIEVPELVKAPQPVKRAEAAKAPEPLKPPEPARAAPNAAAATSARPIAGQNYVVKRGDTLVQIARQAYGLAIHWRRIAEVNKLSNPNLIEIGDVLYLPSAE